MPRLAALFCLALALAACDRGGPSEETRAAAARAEPQRLMPRSNDQRERVPTAGDNRIKCRKPVPSIPCEP